MNPCSGAYNPCRERYKRSPIAAAAAAASGPYFILLSNFRVILTSSEPELSHPAPLVGKYTNCRENRNVECGVRRRLAVVARGVFVSQRALFSSHSFLCALRNAVPVVFSCFHSNPLTFQRSWLCKLQRDKYFWARQRKTLKNLN